MADEIITRYKLDATGYIQGAQQIEAETNDLIKDNKKLETSFGDVNKKAVQALAGDNIKKASDQAAKAIKSVSNEAKNSGNGFLAMRKELKAVQGQLATLASNGRENSKLFKALSAEAGQLKDRMADLGDAINLQGASPLENFTGSIGGARSALMNLDLEGAARAFGVAGAQISKISFKELSAGIGQTVTAFAKLAAGILTNPLFLIAGTVVGIIAVVSQWGDSMEEIAAKNDKAVDRIMSKLDLVTAAYDRQIAELKALGKDTDQIEIARSERIIKETEKAIKIRDKETKKRKENLDEVKRILGSENALTKSTLEDTQNDFEESDKKLTELKEKSADAESAITQIKNAQIKEDNDKSNAAYKKFLEDRKKLLEGFAKEVALLQQEERKQEADIFAEGQKKIDAIIQDNNKKQQADNKKHQDQKRKDTEQALRQQFSDEELSFEDRNRALQEAYDQDLVSWDEYNSAKKKLIEDEVNFNIAQRRREVEATLKFAGDILSITDSLIKIANEANFKNAEAEKAFALFQISLNLAQSLANVILGATEAAAATGPLAPFTLAGYIASGTAAVLAAFAQFASIANQEPPGFAEGGYTGHGGKYDAAGIVHKGEFVATQENTRDYWDELNAIHDGQFEELVMLKYIQPALEAAMHEAKSSQGSSFADNVASSMLLNFRNKDVVGAVLSGHANANKNADKIVKAINKKSSRPSYRKK